MAKVNSRRLIKTMTISFYALLHLSRLRRQNNEIATALTLNPNETRRHFG